MKEDELVSAVRDTARVQDQAQARQAIRATLTVLGDRLTGGETKDLGSQLPGEFRHCLPEQGKGERFGVAEFYERVAEQEGGTPEEARRHARAVMAALKNSIAGGEYDDVAAQLPEDYSDLLQTGPVQH